MATGLLAEEDLSCPVCLEEFNLQERRRHPYILSCSHTFCLDCLKTVYENDGSLKCSLCRTINSISEIEDLTYNNDIIEFLRMKDTGEEISSSQLQSEKLFQYQRPSRWISGAEGSLPPNPVYGGMGTYGELYVGMAKHRGGLIPGMIVPKKKLCYIPWGGQAIARSQYFALDNPGGLTTYWESSRNGNVPEGALKGGKSEDGIGEPLFIARVSIDGATFCGKVHPSHRVCYIPYTGQELAFTQYEVLCVTDPQYTAVNVRYPLLALWVSGFGGRIPPHPVSGGNREDGDVYVGMAKHKGGHILGMVVPRENRCYIPWGCQSIAKDEYYVLDNPGQLNLYWESASGGIVPSGALKAGRSEEGETLFVGRARVSGDVLCGKVHPSHKVCYIPYGERENAHGNYEVLCATDVHCRDIKLP